MKNYLLVFVAMFVLAFFAGSGNAQQNNQATSGNGYNAQIKYPGYYQFDVLYVKNNGSKIIQAIPHLDRLEYVTCFNALDHLQRKGKWQGHLKPDGSCASYDEPAEYTMGNRLNYEELQATN